ncbi:MAG TPA: tetratricopeptide repeat protein [Pyrinomonadaceae bacterium]|nr:tetratricopeptide repeat protein [Pyrinomonadaceae bacterium]
MAFDKAKTLRAAEKYLEVGKIAAAIKEYCQIVAVDADDFTTLNMLGDLYTRVGNTSEAVTCFRRIAEHYREQGFGLKAIAMYKKIDRLQPHDIDIATHLADLYAQQDLIVEARTHYLAIVEAHQRAGSAHSALEVLRRVADLDPQNTQIRTKLADGYLNLGLKKEGAACFSEAGQILVARGAFDDALLAFEKALRVNPADYAILKGMLAAHTARRTADEAAEQIEDALKTFPEDCELLALLASAYLEADDPEQAERATGLLVAKEPAAYLRFMDVARSYLRHDKIAEAVAVVARITEQMLAEREQEQLMSLLDELLAGDADNVQALRLLVRAHWWLRDMENLKAALERLADAAQAAGLDADERYALTQLTRLEPSHEAYLSRLAELGGAEEAAAGEMLPEFGHADESTPVAAVTTDEFVGNSDEVVTPVQEASFEFNNATETSAGWTAPVETPIETGFTFESIVAQELPSNGGEKPTEGNEEERVAAILRPELESVDFYIAQGYIDIAIDTLDLLQQQCGHHPEINARRERITRLQSGVEESAGAPEAIADGEITFEANFEVPIVSEQPAPEVVMTVPVVAEPNGGSPATLGIDAGLAEIFEEYRAFSEGPAEAAANGDYETHYNLGLAYKEMDLFEDALEEFQIAASLASPSDGTPRYLQCCNLLGHCFMQTGVPEVAVKWLTKGLNVPNISDEERMALTYELGAAHEQAGDLEHALESFTEVYGVNVSYRTVNERLKMLKTRLGEKDRSARKAEQTEMVN